MAEARVRERAEKFWYEWQKTKRVPVSTWHPPDCIFEYAAAFSEAGAASTGAGPDNIRIGNRSESILRLVEWALRNPGKKGLLATTTGNVHVEFTRGDTPAPALESVREKCPHGPVTLQTVCGECGATLELDGSWQRHPNPARRRNENE